jgi:4'-phosphopantetheinyl transferase
VLDQPASTVRRLGESLALDERERAGRFHFDRDRDRFIVGRGALRALLGRYLGMEPGRVAFRYGPQGKPALAEGAGTSPLQFNLAHSQGLALLAIAEGRQIGIDVEVIRPVSEVDQLVGRFFSPRECAEFRRVAEGERLASFYRGWTRKEAYLKATGEGLATPLDQFDVTLAPGEPARLLDVAGRPSEVSRWALLDLDPGPEAIAALAVEAAPELFIWRGWRLGMDDL